MNKFTALFKSRRFWASVGSVLAVVMQETIGVTIEQSLVIVGVFQSWVIGDSIKKTG